MGIALGLYCIAMGIICSTHAGKKK